MLQGKPMRILAIYGLTAIVLAEMVGVAQAEPGGCLKYGAAGAVAGHVAGHHAVLGAAGGCAVGMWKRHEYRKHQEQAASQPSNG
jgi:hypothetical protein